MNIVNIEKRKLDYIIAEGNLKLDNVNKRFKEIDDIMKNLKIGSKLYSGNCWGDIFEQNVIEIIDKENGIVKLYEESIDATTVGCVIDYFRAIPKC